MKKRLERILIAEDDPDIQVILHYILEKKGNFTVLTVPSGKEVEKTAEAFQPDLILMDVMMPDMDGIQVFQSLKKNPTLKDLPVIFLTAKTLEEEVEELQSLHPWGILFKPFRPQSLIKDILALWEKGQHRV